MLTQIYNTLNDAMEAPLVGDTPWQEPEYVPEHNPIATATMSEGAINVLDKVIPALLILALVSMALL